MPNLDVTPGALRNAGASLNDGREGLDGGNVELLSGTGDHTRMSTGGFPAGQHADQLLAGLVGATQHQHFVIGENFRALSSALHILADVYETADHEQAVRFAFMDPGAKAPRGLPAYIDAEATGAGDAAPATSAGGTAGGAGHERTYAYPGSPGHMVTDHYDSEGNYLRSDHHIAHPGGRHSYYTVLAPDEGDGPAGVTDVMVVDPQPAPALDEWTAHEKALDEQVEQPMEQMLEQHGL